MAWEVSGSLIVKLAFSALACFLAILLWSKTRDAAWIFVVVGIVVHYGGVIYSSLVLIGIVQALDLKLFGLQLADLLFGNLPTLFYSIAFITLLSRKKGVH